MKKIDKVYEVLTQLEEKFNRGISAYEISEVLKADRSNVSRYLNALYGKKRIDKIEGRPVLYTSTKRGKVSQTTGSIENNLDKIILQQQSLLIPIQQAKAAILYPPRGLHTLILGETGVGKSMFAEIMYEFAFESKVIEKEASFIRFNCADYADNPQLVMAQIFGVKKGAYTGADKDRDGLLKKANGGMLFLDEVHRLSPQGQEMLFTYIDTGVFRALGETEKAIAVDVQIIAATTEDPQSYLLNTFTRRIPMVITLPPLRKKSLGERYYLIEYFIKKESKRIGKSIYVNKNSLISLLLYHCPNNIGQLGSDIQLTCAKAFVNYKSRKEDYILITQSDLPQYVKKGMMRINELRVEIDQLLKTKGDVLRFNYREDAVPNIINEPSHGGDFYDVIEKKLEDLKRSGIDAEEINQIINIDIESHFQKYLVNLHEDIGRPEISKVVDIEVLDTVKEILQLAQNKMNREYDPKIYYGLALHINCFIERVNKGLKIYHPKLNLIRVEYPDEFLVAMEAVKIIDKKFHIQTPLDEVGYLTLFFITNPLDFDGVEKLKVGILVIMHGNTTASSMVEVSNTLVGEQHAIALDMPLSINPLDMYELAKKQVMELDNGRGVLLLVDMGSLTNFGDMIYEETGIIVKTVDMVSTSIVIDACRKAVLGRGINEIYESLRGEGLTNSNFSKAVKMIKKIKKNIIITACFTGEGASERLKGLIEEKLTDCYNLEIIPLNMLDRKAFLASINEYKKNHKILAIISTIDIHMSDILFISAEEMIAGDGLKYLEEVVTDEENYIKIGKSLKSHLKEIDGEKVIDEIRDTITNIERTLNIKVKYEAIIGIILHISFLLDKLKSGGSQTDFNELASYKDQFNREMILIKNCFKTLEVNYGINIGEHELAHICKIVVSNNENETLYNDYN
ncbi:transcriptional regulator, TrmB [Alkaliphilus metalliredigens QYMF]|uniref:Transcriptional regulator, TrmB n=1 Tax=Alkaliphilus metalliredigens (strain QYMF) TaxID=293826 RepID=A6TVQ9_ALKMQ|nr:sigma-54-dependent transcriptional regulator [Alkaliphilus metalliredigens]ABR50277.1 transcriptional regulator, TrmB [Alkaliphilus metalliredigens QYMF]